MNIDPLMIIIVIVVISFFFYHFIKENIKLSDRLNNVLDKYRKISKDNPSIPTSL